MKKEIFLDSGWLALSPIGTMNKMHAVRVDGDCHA